jgi:hypothetical protein
VFSRNSRSMIEQPLDIPITATAKRSPEARFMGLIP